MSEPLLNVMKIMLLAGLYLFFVRVLWSVFNELRDPRTVAPKRRDRVADSAAADVRSTARQVPNPAMGAAAAAAIVPPAVPSPDRRAPTATATIVGQLIVVDPPSLVGVTYALGNEITLGRAATNGIHLDDTYVSTVHARIFLTNGSFYVEDLASRNGSLLNDEPIVATTPLRVGDRLQLGATTMEFS